MSKQFLDLILTICVRLFEFYLMFIEITYLYFKYKKNDERFEKVGLFKYLECPIKTLKGEFKNIEGE